MTTEALSLLKSQKPFSQAKGPETKGPNTKGQNQERATARIDTAFSSHLQQNRAPIEQAERREAKSPAPQARDERTSRQEKTDDRHQSAETKTERRDDRAHDQTKPQEREQIERSSTDESAHSRDTATDKQAKQDQGEQDQNDQTTKNADQKSADNEQTAEQSTFNQEAALKQEGQAATDAETPALLLAQTQETTLDQVNKESAALNPLNGAANLQSAVNNAGAENPNSNNGQKITPLSTHPLSNQNPLHAQGGDVLNNAGPGGEGGDQAGQVEKAISDLAKTGKETPSSGKPLLTSGAGAQAELTPILTNSAQNGAQAGGNFFKTANFTPLSTEAASAQTLEGPDGISGSNSSVEGKGTPSTNSLRGPAYTNPTQSIALSIAQKAQNGVQQFEIRLNPPELGRVDVRLEFGKDGHVTTHLIVERPETLEMLNKDSRQLTKALEEAGVNLDNDGLSFSLKDQGGAETSHEEEASNHTHNAQDDENQAAINSADLENNPSLLARLLNPAGLDVRI